MSLFKVVKWYYTIRSTWLLSLPPLPICHLSGGGGDEGGGLQSAMVVSGLRGGGQVVALEEGLAMGAGLGAVVAEVGWGRRWWRSGWK